MFIFIIFVSKKKESKYKGANPVGHSPTKTKKRSWKLRKDKGIKELEKEKKKKKLLMER